MNNKDKKEDRVFAVNYSQVDPKTDQNTQLALAKMELTYAIIGQVLGLVCILGGIGLFLNGVTGSTSWTANILGAESAITDAAPGAILFIVGIFMVLVTKYKFVHKKAS
ncbi:hypothetical protein EAG18_19165 [Pseudoalteromonas sp. J010]|uniref:hypothetical protein n=1 Tax=Pseudoalteromonas sp. J010 TaxID=998465 RepID=UPI000F6451B9|nr:hypothetical protein [Pseudoalteromonas sp. J010]RRS07067.1 hypothetical protein EAG18_19165 [Pseudoalteromonas sp. J010]